MERRTPVLGALLVLAACGDNLPVRTPDAMVDALTPRPSPTSCKPPARGTVSVGLEPAFPNLAFNVPVDVVWAPSDPTTAYVVEYGGTVRSVADPNAPFAPVVLDLSSYLTRFTGEIGLWDIAFHPNYPATPYLYAFLSGTGGPSDFRSLLLRFTTPDGGETIDASSEEVLLEIERIPGTFHGGGKLGFSTDGLLLLSTGDDSSQQDSQDLNNLFGKLLRIDVDSGDPYGIPPTNPYAEGGGRPEIYAHGFRNPWRWSFDRANGDIWLGDVGRNTMEEINKVTLGGNYGWPHREGTMCGIKQPCTGDFIDPVHAYGRDQGASVTGGYVYRGSAITELYGRYIFGDYVSGRMWSYGDGTTNLLFESGLAISAFAEEPGGELLVSDVNHGKIYRLVPTIGTAPGVPAPYLSATGCQEDPGLLPYVVNSPLWSDGLDKERFIALPEGTTITAQPDGSWDFPNDTILVKTFSMGERRVETRLLIKQDDKWTGWSYQWFGNQTGAQRVDSGGTLDLGDRQWHFPSTAECSRCHTAAAHHALGPHQNQMDHDTQLLRLQQWGMLDSVANVEPLVAVDDTAADLSRRARSYLHANCSMCHRPGGPGQGALDLRYTTPLAETGTCDKTPSLGTLDLSDPKLIAPGAPERSVLLARMSRRGEYQMPPLASSVIDSTAVETIQAWIASLSSCESE